MTSFTIFETVTKNGPNGPISGTSFNIGLPVVLLILAFICRPLVESAIKMYVQKKKQQETDRFFKNILDEVVPMLPSFMNMYCSTIPRPFKNTTTRNVFNENVFGAGASAGASATDEPATGAGTSATQETQTYVDEEAIFRKMAEQIFPNDPVQQAEFMKGCAVGKDMLKPKSKRETAEQAGAGQAKAGQAGAGPAQADQTEVEQAFADSEQSGFTNEGHPVETDL